jgi:methyl-accepting chemotaxis protein
MNSVKISVKTRLYATLTLAMLVTILVGVLGLHGARTSNRDLDAIFSSRLLPTGWVGQIESRARDVLARAEDVVIRQDTAGVKGLLSRLGEQEADTQQLWDKLDRLDLTSGERRIADELGRYGAETMANIKDALAAAQAGTWDKAEKILIEQARPAYEKLSTTSSELLTAQISVAKDMRAHADTSFKLDSALIGGAIVLGMSIAGLLGFFLVRSIVSALSAAVQVADRIAGGQLGSRIDVDGTDELGQLLQALKRMDGKLVEIVGGVRESAASVGAAARQLSHGNDDLSQRTQEQAAALEETASSMEQMTATVRQNADNARQANQLAVGAREQAERGGSVVERAIGAMGDINSSSRKIADIISVIDEIAFQTNLLALNAAVEAARAGEQGRGFAVVATEVRNLAQRSASAAREIKQLINDSVEKVKAGSALVDESGKTLAEIMESVKKVTDIVAEIAAASEEQSAGIEQVNNAVTQMDNVTQQNAALVEEASAASKSMEQQSTTLVSQIGYFATGEHPAHAPVASHEPRVAVKPVAKSAPSRRPTAVPAAARSAPVARPGAPLARASGDDSVWQEF